MAETFWIAATLLGLTNPSQCNGSSKSDPIGSMAWTTFRFGSTGAETVIVTSCLVNYGYKKFLIGICSYSYICLYLRDSCKISKWASCIIIVLTAVVIPALFVVVPARPAIAHLERRTKYFAPFCLNGHWIRDTYENYQNSFVCAGHSCECVVVCVCFPSTGTSSFPSQQHWIASSNQRRIASDLFRLFPT